MGAQSWVGAHSSSNSSPPLCPVGNRHLLVGPRRRGGGGHCIGVGMDTSESCLLSLPRKLVCSFCLNLLCCPQGPSPFHAHISWFPVALQGLLGHHASTTSSCQAAGTASPVGLQPPRSPGCGGWKDRFGVGAEGYLGSAWPIPL